MRGIIVAVPRRSANPGLADLSGGVMGVGGAIPWHYPGDLRRFKRVTLGTTVIMGRLTWASIGRPLAGRRNVVITRSSIPGLETYPSIPMALTHIDGPLWFIGGARVYADALALADRIDVTFVPDEVTAPAAVRFPEVNATEWHEGPLVVHEDDARLVRRVCTKIT